MARIIIITSGISSIYYPNLEMGRRLEAAGHEIIYGSQDEIEAVVVEHGFRYIQLPGDAPHVVKPRSESLSSRIRNLPNAFLNMAKRRAAKVAELEVEQFQTIMRELDPDLFLIDVELHPIILGALGLEKPVGLTSTWISLFKRSGVPPLHKTNLPGEGFSGSNLGIELTWLLYRTRKYLYNWAAWGIHAGTDRLSLYRALATQNGLNFARVADRYQWLIPIVYRDLPVLYLNAIDFDFPQTPHPQAHYVGPMMRLQELSRISSGAENERLEALLDRHRDPATKGDRKLVYCAFGAFHRGNDTGFFQRVVKGMAHYPEWDVIFGLGGRVDPSSIGDVPDNVHLFGWVPQVKILSLADAAIVHAGISTIKECIFFGVPMLTYPFHGDFDQDGNAARIAFHQLGIVGDRAGDSDHTIGSHVARLLAEPQYRQPIESMSQQFRQFSTEKDLLPVIEQLLEKRA